MKHNVNKDGQTHDQLQRACWVGACKAYFPFMYRRLIAIPNDMHAGNVVRWKQYEALGVTPGVWDMCLYWFDQRPALPFPESATIDLIKAAIIPAVHWFEFKVGSDDLGDEQKKFRETMLSLGHKFYIISEEKEFRTIINSIVEPTIHIAKQIWNKE